MATDRKPDDRHKAQYDAIRADHPTLPEWHELTDRQRQSVREANRRQADFMRRLGLAIAQGTPIEDVKW